MAAARACVLSTQPHRVASKPCFLAMSAIRRFAAGILLIASLCASAAHAETARITFILVNDIYLMADQMRRALAIAFLSDCGGNNEVKSTRYA
jgi:Na+/pantothenate symporter